ncbi:hypothetical protein [Niastella caeni]|uniref:hypothetical protein n=1 Tax=Niastella caeni TaxID=2569763 RepID=UPI00129A11BD|nr:hypothetical protein [Niastella caeni]
MYRNQRPVSIGKAIAIQLVLISAIALQDGMVADPEWYSLLWITIPLLLICGFLYEED